MIQNPLAAGVSRLATSLSSVISSTSRLSSPVTSRALPFALSASLALVGCSLRHDPPSRDGNADSQNDAVVQDVANDSVVVPDTINSQDTLPMEDVVVVDGADAAMDASEDVPLRDVPSPDVAMDTFVMDTVDVVVPDATMTRGPSLRWPMMSQILSPTRGYILWSPDAVPAGRTIREYENCYTAGPRTDIDDEGECPNASRMPQRHRIIDPLSAGSSYYWKVRTVYDDGSMGPFSDIGNFSTDDSVLVWCRMDGMSGAMLCLSNRSGVSGAVQGTPSFSSGISNNAIRFPGSGRVYLSDNAALENLPQMSFETWVRTSSSASSFTLGAKWFDQGSYLLRRTSGAVATLQFLTYTTSPASVGSVTPINDDSWHYVVGTYDGASQSLFIDGNREATVSQTGTIRNSYEALCLGGACDAMGAVGAGLDGLIDEMVIYNIALSRERMLNSRCASSTPNTAVAAAPCD